MFVGVDSFEKGEVLSQLVFSTAERKMRHLGGWEIRDGIAVPDNLPTRLSTSALGTVPEQVPFIYRKSDGTERIICRDGNNKLRVMPTSGSSAGVWGSALDSVLGLPDVAPIRINNLVVFPTQGADAKLVSFEPDSPSTLTRPFSFRGPQDYDAAAAPSVSIIGFHPAVQFFDLTAYNLVIASDQGGHGTVYGGGSTHQWFSMDNNNTDNALMAHLTLGTPANLGSSQYLVLDLAMTYVGDDPTLATALSGNFYNADQAGLGSGMQLVLYSDTSTWGPAAELARFDIPALVGSIVKGAKKATPTIINRVAFNLGSIKNWKAGGSGSVNTLVKGIGIALAKGWSCPSGSRWYFHMYSNPFDTSLQWKFSGNVYLPSVRYQWSPWYDQLPPDPGDTTETGSVSGSNYTPAATSACVVESFPPSFAYFSPDHPLVQWMYCFRGVDQLSTPFYNQMISNPSLTAPTPPFFADPWLTYQVDVTLPSFTDTATPPVTHTVSSDYGDYFTHVFIYRQVYTGLVADEITGNLGVWNDPEYAGFLTAANVWEGYIDAGVVGVSGAVQKGSSSIDCSAGEQPNFGDVITFLPVPGTTTPFGGALANTPYYVTLTVGGGVFVVNTAPDGATPAGTVLVFNASGAVLWSSAPPELALGISTIPQYVELNHDYADSAHFIIVADNRVYATCLTFNFATEVWNRPLIVEVSNLGDYGSFPTTPSDDSLATDGEELGSFSPDAATIRGLLAKDDIKYLWTDSGFYEIIGSDASQGWQFLRRDRIPLGTQKSAVDCRTTVQWQSGGTRGHFYSYMGARAEPISVNQVDSALIDWTKPHGFVCSGEKYIGFCYYNDPDPIITTPWCLLQYDQLTGAWTRRHSAVYNLAGICCADPVSTVYGLTYGGDILNIFGGTGLGCDYLNLPTWMMATQYIETPDGKEHHTRYLHVESVAPSEGPILVTVNSYGRVAGQVADQELMLLPTKENYAAGDLNVDLTGFAFQIILSWEQGATVRGVTPMPPTIFPHMGLELDDEPQEI